MMISFIKGTLIKPSALWKSNCPLINELIVVNHIFLF